MTTPGGKSERTEDRCISVCSVYMGIRGSGLGICNLEVDCSLLIQLAGRWGNHECDDLL
jgi:hypothetical protein